MKLFNKKLGKQLTLGEALAFSTGIVFVGLFITKLIMAGNGTC